MSETIKQKSLRVCIINTSTNGLHTAYGIVSKKNLYGIGRLIMVEYLIGHYIDGKFVQEKKEKFILTPDTINYHPDAQKIHKITMDKAYKKGRSNVYVMNKLSDDLKNVSIIIGHNLKFHLKALQAECFRSCVRIFFNNYTLVDTGTYNLEDKYISYEDLKNKYNIESNSKLRVLKKAFYKLYQEFNK